MVIIQSHTFSYNTSKSSIFLACSPFVPQAVRLESGWSDRVRYMVVIYTNGHQDTEENIVVGMDFTDKDR